nr:glutaminase [Brucella gallinifaecis]
MRTVLNEIVAELKKAEVRGKVADYIPPLARIDPAKFGIAIMLHDGTLISAGDAKEKFSIQSISKVFALVLALGKRGDSIWQRVSREPSGDPFNSSVLLELEKGIPRNPFINAGAIVIADILLSSHKPCETIAEIVRFVQSVADDDDIYIDEHVAKAENRTGFNNAALANLLKANSNLENVPSHVLGVYHHQCALAMSCEQLARSALFLSSSGRDPISNHQIVSVERALRINSLMMTCGHYDGSGDFAFRVGVPAKSGVGGGILAIVPGIASVAVWSPGLNQHGNSLLGTRALEKLCRDMNWSVFGGTC